VRRIAGRVNTNFSACATHSPVERRAVQQHGTNTAHPVNMDAVTVEIKRIKHLAGITNPKSLFPKADP
jgi:hypothetical protein